MNARVMQTELMKHIRTSAAQLILPNVYLLGNPWESDVIKVTSSFYWHEYEIKTTKSDYLRDFSKTFGYANNSINKHDSYAAKETIKRPYFGGQQIPKPKSFTFVVPVGLLEEEEVPSHCGVIEYDPDAKPWKMKHIRKSPTLSKPTKLTEKHIWNLALKAAYRVHMKPVEVQ